MSDNPIHLSEVPGAVRQACATVLSYAIARGAEYGRTEAGVLRDLFGLELLRGSPPGDTPAPAELFDAVFAAAKDAKAIGRGPSIEWLRSFTEHLAPRLARGAGAGSSAPECESCHALRNQLQTAQTKLRIRERGVREEPPAP